MVTKIKKEIERIKSGGIFMRLEKIKKSGFGKTLLLVIAMFVVATTYMFCDEAPSPSEGVFVNQTRIEGVKPIIRNAKVYVPLTPVVKGMGKDEVLKDGMATVRIGHSGKEYRFSAGSSVYYVNEKPQALITKDINGIRVPEYASIISEDEIVYIPTTTLQNVFGYKVTIANDNTLVYIGTVPSVIPKPGDGDGDTSEIPNKDKGISEGWIAPKVKSKSTDNFEKDLTTLVNELELNWWTGEPGENIYFNPYGNHYKTIKTAIGRSTGYKESDYYCNIQFWGYYNPSSNPDDYYDKMQIVNPQILKFYFPTQYKYIHNMLMADKDSELVGKHNWDGREVLFTKGESSTTLYFSKVGGKITVK